jgi:excisionase family DNA binding protein
VNFDPTTKYDGTAIADRIAYERIDQLLDSAQAAFFLGIHRKTLQRIIRSDQMPALRVGRLWRFRKSDLNAWLDSQAHLRLR